MTLALPELLDHLMRHPAMFVHPVTFFNIRDYFSGLRAGLRFAGIAWDWDDYHAAAEARGWDPRSNIGILRDFTRHGLSDAEMVRELIAVEVDAYRRTLTRVGRWDEPPPAGGDAR